MTIRPGQAWGRTGTCPEGVVTVRTDREASRLTRAAGRDGTEPAAVVLSGGDLARTAGTGRGHEVAAGDECQLLPMDRGEVLVDGELHHFVAHVVARRSWWRGPVLAIMNAQFLGDWDVAPRSHPNDGRLDVVEADLSLADRWKARSRLRSGTHVPHPGISVRRVTGAQFDLVPGTRVWVDGEEIGTARTLSVRCVPDAFTVAI